MLNRKTLKKIGDASTHWIRPNRVIDVSIIDPDRENLSGLEGRFQIEFDGEALKITETESGKEYVKGLKEGETFTYGANEYIEPLIDFTFGEFHESADDYIPLIKFTRVTHDLKWFRWQRLRIENAGAISGVFVNVRKANEDGVLQKDVAITGAQEPTYGGIDLNPAMLELQIKRDERGRPLPIYRQPIMEMNIEGFLPVIINITPVSSLPLLLGLGSDKEDNEFGHRPDYNARLENQISMLN